ncbi:MAG: TonB-dependent receptor [Desulfuromonas sp.]|nr:TonB-dependent receptor [Desulfuromonas sp.]
MRRLWWVGLLLLCWVPNVWATEQLDEVVVTASRVAEPVNEVALRTVIIDQDDMRMSSATTIDQLLLEQNIGHMHAYPGALTQVSMRGFRSKGVSAGFSSPILILMDGRRAGTSNLAKLPVDMVERIEILKGASSAVYGAEAMGGVINIITKQGRGASSAAVLVEAGSASRIHVAAEAQGEVSGLDFYALTGRKDQRADYRDGDGDVYENTQSRSRENFVNLGYTAGQHRLGATVLEVDNWHVGSPSTQAHPTLDDYSSKDLRSFDINYTGGYSAAGLEWLLRYYQVEDSDLSYFASSEYSSATSYTYDTDTRGAQIQLTWQAGISRLTLGVDWDEQEARNAQSPTGQPFGVNADYERRGVFVAEKFALFSERLLLNLGLRYDHYNVETKDTQGYTTLLTNDENVSEWCPRAGLVFVASDNLRLKASVGRGVVLPTASELAGDFVNSGWYQDSSGAWQSYNVHYLGNSDLDMEQSWTYEVGVDYTQQYWYMNASLFYTDYEDKIEPTSYYDAVAGETVSSYANIAGATINGMEWEAGCDLAPLFKSSWAIEPFASLTYLFEFEDDATKDDLLYVSATQARFGVKTTSTGGFMAQLLGIYHGEQDFQNWDTYPTSIDTMGGYTLWNLMLSQRVLLPWREGMEMTIGAGVENILDKSYAYVKGYSMPGREYKVSLKLTF